MRATRVVGNVAANRARLLRRGVGRVVQPEMGDLATEIEVEHARLHPGDALVGVDLEDPVGRAGVDAGIAPLALDVPASFEQAVGVAAGDLARPVGAFVEHDDDLVREAQRVEAIGELLLFVVCHDEGRQPDRDMAGHRAAGSRRRHSARAASSARSTLRPSISVPVVRWS